ncbi:hypothetical protein PRIPAC_92309 [Pristionchus pacificus]|uniref:Uncharacterized protein n=1 Tax=Pristionchus pacificus TaxID=54126 RepID=A0A2A6BAC7_PRIPA|nr:hypothetical protein PRIPAC_92309 [Pristionchus pacificus]|eukprot:PDM62824.1 hypothetical protein PRIPAC_50039 [Pristionchus pacificus]
MAYGHLDETYLLSPDDSTHGEGEAREMPATVPPSTIKPPIRMAKMTAICKSRLAHFPVLRSRLSRFLIRVWSLFPSTPMVNFRRMRRRRKDRSIRWGFCNQEIRLHFEQEKNID